MNPKQSTTINNPFNLERPVSIDIRFVINSIQFVDQELPIANRYSGLIFWSNQEQSIWYFGEDLTTPINLFLDFNSRLKFSISARESSIFTELNKYPIQNGTIVYWNELGVNLQKVGNSYKYHSGIWDVKTGINWAQIPNVLKIPGTKVNYLGTDSIITQELGIDAIKKEFTSSSKPEFPIPGNLYSIDGVVHVAYGDKTEVKYVQLGRESYNVGVFLNAPETIVWNQFGTKRIKIDIFDKTTREQIFCDNIIETGRIRFFPTFNWPNQVEIFISKL